MPTVSGIVEQVTPVAAVQGAPAGSTAATVRIRRANGTKRTLTIPFGPADGPATQAAKQAILDLLRKARDSGWSGKVGHAAGSTHVQTVTLGGSDIMPIGRAIQGDFYTVTGKGIPKSTTLKLILTGELFTAEVPPVLARPEWVLAAALPTLAEHNLPPGRYTLQLKATGWSSDTIPVDLEATAPPTVRVLNLGASKTEPYAVAFVANPAVPAQPGSGPFDPDSAIDDRPFFQAVVGHCLQVLLARPEDLVSQFDPKVRFVAVLDPVGPSDASALLQAHPTEAGILEPRRNKVKSFVAARGVRADIVFVLHGFENRDRACAWGATDDMTGATTKFTYGGADRFHGHLTKVPGSIALPMHFVDDQMALHEFCHAAAEVANGVVIDLYLDEDLDGGGIAVGPRINKKWRDAPVSGQPPAAIPTTFVKYQTVTYKSAKKRSGSDPYPPHWLSYHPAPKVKSRPNLMDDYDETDEPQKCRLDKLAYAWLRDRLQVKLGR